MRIPISLKKLAVFALIWVVDMTWPGYPFVRYRWYYDCGCRSPWVIEWYKTSLPPHPSKLHGPDWDDPNRPGGPNNL